SMESFAVWPHSAPLPVNEARQPILTLRPASFCASAFCVDDTRDTMAAMASDVRRFPGTLIALHLPKCSSCQSELIGQGFQTHHAVCRILAPPSPFVRGDFGSCCCPR